MTYRTALPAAVLGALLLSGCVSLSRAEQTTLRELRGYGISSTEKQIKSPAVAGWLNVLPGIGNFYLAVGTEEGTQWVYGFLNLLAWPLSVLWGIPQATTDANTLNKRETIYYYTLDPVGKQELEQKKLLAQQPTMTIAEVIPPSAPAAAPGPNPAAIPHIFEKGTPAKSKAGAKLRFRADIDAEAVLVLEPGATVTLDIAMNNTAGKWWYAEFEGKKGWILESELEAYP